MLTEDEVKMLKAWLALMISKSEKRDWLAVAVAYENCLDYINDIFIYRDAP